MKKWNELEDKQHYLTGKRRQVQGISLKIGKALVRLLLCEMYSQKVLEMARKMGWGNYKTANDFFGSLQIIPGRKLLNGNLEQMKAWSNKTWYKSYATRQPSSDQQPGGGLVR